MTDSPLDANRALWDAWTALHIADSHYDVEEFVRDGTIRLDSVARAEVGDVRGKSLLHLQCHFGLDTLSWARLGATVTGADFSPASIAAARAIAGRCGLTATFVESEITRLAQHLNGEFDIVFTSHGAIGWLPDLHAWAAVVAHFVKPGGFFYILEGHPAGLMFDDRAAATPLTVGYPYFPHAIPFVVEEHGSYAAPEGDYHGASHNWSHSLSEIVCALIDAGLRIEYLREFPFCRWQMLPLLVRRDDGFWHMPSEHIPLPLMFSIKASRPLEEVTR